MKSLDKDTITKLASDLMLELTDTETAQIEKDAVLFAQQVAALHHIDTAGVTPMSYPFEEERQWLRDDVANHVISQELAFENAPRIEGDYFEIVKVVNK